MNAWRLQQRLLCLLVGMVVVDVMMSEENETACLNLTRDIPREHVEWTSCKLNASGFNGSHDQSLYTK